jgi:4-hydroxy 2-oxovalerate aldolase
MDKIVPFEILDCTLRDGGYYTNWDFDDALVEKYFSAMYQLPVDILEIGYRSTPQKDYMGKYFYFPDFVAEKVAKMNGGKKLSLMFNEKATRPEHLNSLLKGLDGIIGLIRLAVDPKQFGRALVLAKAIKERGFDVAFNVIYMSKYAHDREFLKKMAEVNGVVEYLNIVDSYGGLLPQQVSNIVKVVKSRVDVKVGYHAHNNLELAFANTLAAIDAGCEIVDATILGMGRGAGNLKTELLLTHMASHDLADFDFNVLSSLIEAWTPLHKEHEWGTNLPYMVSGANSLPQKDVMEWVTQRYYSYNSIIRALHNQKSGEADNVRLPVFKPEKRFENVVIIGGGPNARLHAEAVKRFINQLDDACIIHASSKNAKSYEDVDVDQYFCLVGNEGHRLEDVFNDLYNFHGQCILPAYPRKMGTYIPEMVKEVSFELKAVDFTDKHQDSHTALALQTALELKATNVFVAGYDGYANGTISPKEQALISENEHSFQNYQKISKLVGILPTKYSIDVQSVYSLIK